MLVSLILSFLLYISYIIYLRVKYKPDCISQSYYLLKHKNIFTTWVIAVSVLIFPAWVEISPENFQFLSFLSVITLISVGVFPRYLEEDRMPHIIGAATTCILSIIWNIVTGTVIIPLILLIIAVIISVFKNRLFWIECLAFLNIYFSILSLVL